ncbi:calcium-binding protein, partial [Vibrio coralliilyticus]|uniref:calcium-binding protein n=1 Tax=Vibrio coralliilyticus TaxID=190893 RepID=UPI000BC899FD
YGFEGAFKDFNEVLDLVEERGVQALSDIANDIGSVGGLSAGAAGVAQALGSVLNQSENSSDLTDVINKINNSRKFEVPHGVSKILANNYVVAAALSASALNEYRKDGDVNNAAKTIVDSAISAPIGAAVGASLAYLLAGTISSPFVLGAAAALAASYIGALAIEELNERGFLDPLYDATENAIAELFGWQPAPPPHRDPLILDLDGNGVSLTESTYFDHNANGIANRTQWVSSTDGLLALDRDGNGTIDSGRELFGDNTLDANGDVASDGYAALKAFDSNGDDVINQKDQVFEQLKVWVDANSDGVSQENELKTLKSLGVESIDLTHDNLHSQYHDASGKSHQTQSVNLDVNNFDRRFVESLAVPESFSSLPDMRGTGTVRDLHEAMTLSGQLSGQIEQFASSSSRDEQVALSEKILFSWAKTSQYYDEHIPVFSGPEIDKVYAIEAFYGDKVPWAVSFGTNGAALALPTGMINNAYDSLVKMIYFELASQTRLKDYYGALTLSSDESGISLSLEGALELFSSRTLNPTLIADAMDFMSAMSSASNSDLTGFYTFVSDALYGFTDADIGELQTAMDFNGIALTNAEEIKKVTFNDGAITFTEGSTSTEITGGSGADVLSGTSLDDVIHAGSGNDVVRGELGNDTLHGSTGNDQLFGGEGNDSLTVAYSGSNTLDG